MSETDRECIYYMKERNYIICERNSDISEVEMV